MQLVCPITYILNYYSKIKKVGQNHNEYLLLFWNPIVLNVSGEVSDLSIVTSLVGSSTASLRPGLV